MKSIRENIPLWIPVGLLSILGLVCLTLLWNISSKTDLGGEDFIAYWSATHLLRNGLNPYDPQLIQSLENAQTERVFEEALMAWNPPPMFVFLLPLAWLPFTTAKFVWLVVNITIVLTGTMMLTRLYLPTGHTMTVIFYLLFAFSLPQIVTGIVIGQVTFLVFLGLVACMALIKKEQWFWAGAVLILTTIKPHMVVLPVLYLLMHMAQRHQYKGWGGLITAGMVCMVILFAFRPQWAFDFFGEMSIVPVNLITPTIGGLLKYYGLSEIGRYTIILLLPLPFIFAKYESAIKMELAMALLTLINVPTTFYGWSFDQVVLLIPIAQVFGWMSLSTHKTINIWMITAIVLSLATIYFQRLLNLNDFYYFWVPLFWWFIFGLTWYLFQSQPERKTELA